MVRPHPHGFWGIVLDKDLKSAIINLHRQYFYTLRTTMPSKDRVLGCDWLLLMSNLIKPRMIWKESLSDRLPNRGGLRGLSIALIDVGRPTINAGGTSWRRMGALLFFSLCLSGLLISAPTPLFLRVIPLLRIEPASLDRRTVALQESSGPLAPD